MKRFLRTYGPDVAQVLLGMSFLGIFAASTVATLDRRDSKFATAPEPERTVVMSAMGSMPAKKAKPAIDEIRRAVKPLMDKAGTKVGE